ncbi:MAG: SDR family NAD(P)-dependent oxidoreductase [Alphaproteobacteria bacterium]|nr:SDR family NAD(P)-dependent oxidoreductase [Alphaproteobacteria bacterium]
MVLACRKAADAEACMETIRSQKADAAVEHIPLDLGDLASVRAFAEAFDAKHDRLDALINNAGVMNTPNGKTKDGFEMQLGVNHLGHFLLTELLLEKLKPAHRPGSSACRAATTTRRWAGTATSTSTTSPSRTSRTTDGRRTPSPSSPTCCTPRSSRSAWRARASRP